MEELKYYNNTDKTLDNLLQRKKIIDHDSNNFLKNITVFFNSNESEFNQKLSYWL